MVYPKQHYVVRKMMYGYTFIDKKSNARQSGKKAGYKIINNKT